jgi:hypothetical protein
MDGRDVGYVGAGHRHIRDLAQRPDDDGSRQQRNRDRHGDQTETGAEQQETDGHHAPRSQALRDRRNRQLEKDDQQAVERDQRPEDRAGVAVGHLQCEAGERLDQHDHADGRGRQEDEEAAIGDHRPNPALAVRRPSRSLTLRQSQQRDNPERYGCDGIAQEEVEERALRQEAAYRRPGGEPSVHGQAVHGKGGDTLTGRREVGEQRRGRRPVELGGEAGERGQRQDGRQAVGL